MTPIRTVVHDRRIELPAPADIPDGTEMLIDVTPVGPGKVGIDESQWRDDPEALADWDAWLKTIEPLEWTADERAAHERFEEAVRRFNVEAARKQMFADEDRDAVIGANRPVACRNAAEFVLAALTNDAAESPPVRAPHDKPR